VTIIGNDTSAATNRAGNTSRPLACCDGVGIDYCE
jgi:hypothetical protein